MFWALIASVFLTHQINGVKAVQAVQSVLGSLRTTMTEREVGVIFLLSG